MDPYSAGADALMGIANMGIAQANANRAAAAASENKALNEARGLFDWGRQREAQRAQRDIDLGTGNWGAWDFMDPNLLAPMQADAAQQEIWKGATGYSPASDLNPFLRTTPGMAEYMDTRKAEGEAFAQRMSEAYAEQQQELARQAVESNERMKALEQQDRDFQRARLEQGDASEQEDLARLIVESWINSNAKASAAGNRDFEERKGLGGRRLVGANENAKRQWVENMRGNMTYEELLANPQVARYIATDPNAAPLRAEYERFR